MRGIRMKRLLCAVSFSFGALCGVLCMRRLPDETCETYYQRCIGLISERPGIAVFAVLLAWPLLICIFGVSFLGDVFVSALLIVCGFCAGASVLVCLAAGCKGVVILLALVPFSCCVVSFAAEVQSTAAGLRRRLLPGSPGAALDRYALRRMVISLLILLLEAVCLLQYVLSFQ